jgi:hypothetical protein
MENRPGPWRGDEGAAATSRRPQTVPCRQQLLDNRGLSPCPGESKNPVPMECQSRDRPHRAVSRAHRHRPWGSEAGAGACRKGLPRTPHQLPQASTGQSSLARLQFSDLIGRIPPIPWMSRRRRAGAEVGGNVHRKPDPGHRECQMSGGGEGRAAATRNVEQPLRRAVASP